MKYRATEHRNEKIAKYVKVNIIRQIGNSQMQWW